MTPSRIGGKSHETPQFPNDGWRCRVGAGDARCRQRRRCRSRANAGRYRPADFGSPGSLRDLAAPIGLHIGTAVIPFDLDTPAYAAILAEQFSAVTPGNAMKWGVVEPVQGQFDWSDADTLVSFAEQHGQLVRGHTLLWHNQLPDWLTTGVANGTISSSQLMSLLEAAHLHRSGALPRQDLAVGRRE